MGFVQAINAKSRGGNPLGLSVWRADPQSSALAADPDAAVLLRLDAEFGNPGLGMGREKGRLAEVVQAVIGAHPNTPVAPILKDGLDQIRGHPIALAKRFYLPVWM